MKHLFACLFLITVVFSDAYSQGEFLKQTNNYKMGVGPIIGFKFGVNAADTQDGIKNGLGIAGMPDFGAQFYMPLDPESKMGLILDAVYANYPYVQVRESSNIEWTYRYQYLGIGANVYISGFTVGLNIGFPIGGNVIIPFDDLEIPTSSLNTMFEFRIGGNITLNESNMGRLLLFINAGYQINGQYTDEVDLGTFNPHPASLQIGLGYLLNME